MKTVSMTLSATFLALALACGGDAQPAVPDGATLFERENCVLCHGRNGEGQALGPPLHGKKAAWTREKLVLYLMEPQAYAERDPRLAEQGKKFLQPMPSYRMLTEPELEALADHVLAMP